MHRLITAVIWLGMLLAGCTAAPSTTPLSPAATAPANFSAGPRTLQIGILGREPSAGIVLFTPVVAAAQEPAFTIHDGLSVYGATTVPQPRLAVKIPRIDDGDWQVFPDGSMDVTWKLRPNLT